MEAIILAGGFGTRLKEVVSEVPKSMAPINGRPFLEYLLDFLLSQGITRVVLSVGYLKESIINHFQRKYRNLEIDYAIEEEALGTGGGIRLSFWKIQSERAFVLNGDSLFRCDLPGMMEFHRTKKAVATLALRKVPDTARYGRVLINRSRRITAFLEKDGQPLQGYINSGIYIMEKQFLMEPCYRGKFSIERDCFEVLAGKERIFGFPADGYFLDIGIPGDFYKAQDDFKAFDHRS